jgi:hypothetical protein
MMGKPTIVCLCGSTRFSEAFQKANLNETLSGNIVLTIGCDMKSDNELFEGMSPESLEKIKADLDELHLRKIDLADEVLILNVDGYIGQSTRRELDYAITHGKKIRFLEPTDEDDGGDAEPLNPHIWGGDAYFRY